MSVIAEDGSVAIAPRKRAYSTGAQIAFSADGHCRLLASAHRAIGSPEFVSMRGTPTTGVIRIFPQSEPGPEHIRVLKNTRYFGRTLAAWMKRNGFVRKHYEVAVIDGHLEFTAQKES